MKKSLEFNPNCRLTCIGSLPFADGQQAVETIFKYSKDFPFWPQLPKRDPKESMLTQFIENFNFLEMSNQSITVRKDYSKFLENFFSEVINRNLDYFKISSEYALGLKIFFDFLGKNKPRCNFLKGQITGPFTLASGIKMPDGNNLLSDAQLLDCLVSGLAMKAAWQVEEFKRLGYLALIFIDEPYLACFGSGFTPVLREDVIEITNRLIDAIDEPDCLKGLHCCSNTDWSMLLETEIDIVSFDAFSYMERFVLYPDDLKRFLKKGGMIAWGIVPTSEFKPAITIKDLALKFEQGVNALIKKGLDRDIILARSLLTPSCGMGTMSVEDTQAVLRLLSGLSEHLRDKFSLS